jgi:hypothetical protein
MRFVLLREDKIMPYNVITMEQHPVPQNVTTFQFRLIGDMTIKQFGYLAAGAILAYISYKLPLPFFFTWPLSTVFIVGGIGFAFVPIEERPMDVWVLSFIKSIYSPTNYVWSHDDATARPPPPVKAAAPPPPVAQPAPAANAQAHEPSRAGRTIPDVVKGVFEQKVPVSSGRIVSTAPQASPWEWVMKFFSFSPSPKAPPADAPTMRFTTPPVAGKTIDLSPPPIVGDSLAQAQKKKEELEQKLEELKKDLEDKTMTEARVLELQKQLTEVLAQKEKMQTELEALRQQAAPPPAPAASVPPPPAPAASGSHVATPQTPKTPTVKIITPESAVKAGLPRLTTFPNVVTGIIKDSDNNLLPGVLVTVKDKNAMPLRALKTNRLGQFAASTPLANGTYFIEIEDPRGRYVFDRVQITLNGSVVPAIEIVAKSQKQINRAMIEKELFGNQQ